MFMCSSSGLNKKRMSEPWRAVRMVILSHHVVIAFPAVSISVLSLGVLLILLDVLLVISLLVLLIVLLT